MKRLHIFLVVINVFLSTFLVAQKPINVGNHAYAVYLLKGEKNILIDAGLPGMDGEIEQNLKKNNVQPSEISFIILTHGHYDHVGCAASFKQKYGTQIIVGEGDETKCTTGKTGNYRITSPQKWLVKQVLKHGKIPTMFEPTTTLKKFEILDLAEYGINANVKVMGGHTDGSLVVMAHDKSWCLVGDLLRGSVVPLFHWMPKIHFFAENPSENWRIIRTLLDEGYQKFYPAHFGPITAKRVRKKFYAMR